MGGDLICSFCLQLLLFQSFAIDSKIPKITLSLLSLQYKKNISFFSNGVGSLLAATSSMLCLFLDQNKDYRPEDGFPASRANSREDLAKAVFHLAN